jgi:hypothetical protein
MNKLFYVSRLLSVTVFLYLFYRYYKYDQFTKIEYYIIALLFFVNAVILQRQLKNSNRQK